MDEVTRMRIAVDQGVPHAAEELLPLVYTELRRLAARRLAQEKPGNTLDATGLVHEAYLRLVGGGDAGESRWNSRGHFFAAAAEAMRRILVEKARRKKAEKHGGRLHRVNLDDWNAVAAAPEDLLALDDALERLSRHDPRSGELVKLHCFAGLTVEQAGAELHLSRTHAYRLWIFARAWLHCQLGGDQEAES